MTVRRRLFLSRRTPADVRKPWQSLRYALVIEVAAARLGRPKGLPAEFVLVPGSTQTSAGWDRLAAALGARGHRVTAIDLPPGRPERPRR